MICVYCGSSGPFTDEHVLTRALSGEGENWVLHDLVCADCNSLFSRYERRWLAQPGLSHARIKFGPVSRSRSGRAFQAHPSTNLFLKAKNDPLHYEVDLLLGFEPRIRMQVIATSDDVIATAGHEEGRDRFKVAYDLFAQKPEITIQKRTKKGPQQYRIAVLDLLSCPVRVMRIELREKPAAAWRDKFPKGPQLDGELERTPRVSIDPESRLRFRVRRLSDIVSLLDRMFAKRNFNSAGGVHDPGSYHLVSREVVDVDPSSAPFRAIAKTAVNFAVAEFGSNWISSPNFRPILDFCLSGRNDLAHPVVGIVKPFFVPLKAIQNAPPEKHAMALLSNGTRVIGLLRLYGADVYRIHLGPPPTDSAPFLRAVHIDYNGPGRVPVT